MTPNDNKEAKNGPEQNEDKSSQENQNPSDASNPPPKLPSVPFQAPSWLRDCSWWWRIAILYGLFRYGPLLLDAFRDCSRRSLAALVRSRRNG